MKLTDTNRKRGGRGSLLVGKILEEPTYFVIRISGIAKGKPAFNCQVYGEKTSGLENYVSSQLRSTVNEILTFVDGLKPVVKK